MLVRRTKHPTCSRRSMWAPVRHPHDAVRTHRRLTRHRRLCCVGITPSANSSGSFATLAAMRRASSLVSIFAVDRRSGDRKWLKAGIGVSPTRVLHGRASSATTGAACALTKHVTRRPSSPANDGRRARERRVMLAAFAPQPDPWRRSLEVAERGAGTWARLVAPSRLPIGGIPQGQIVRLTAHDGD